MSGCISDAGGIGVGFHLATAGDLSTETSTSRRCTHSYVVTRSFDMVRTLRKETARTNLYNNFGPAFLADFSVPDVSMFAAVYYGLYNYYGDQFLVNPTCSTGNCTWSGGYTSLGVCSRCSDVTTLIVSLKSTFYDWFVTDLPRLPIARHGITSKTTTMTTATFSTQPRSGVHSHTAITAYQMAKPSMVEPRSTRTIQSRCL